MNQYTFKSKKDYEEYLKKLLKDIGRLHEYNISMHQTKSSKHTHSKKTTTEEVLKNNVKSIIKYGLDLQEYDSIFGTTKLIGNTSKFDSRKIVNYSYYDEVIKATIILAIPKYIKVGKQKVEFSSFKGGSLRDGSKLFGERIKNEHIIIDQQHTIQCPLDVIHISDIPKEFILGAQIIKSADNEIEFYLNEQHISKLDKNKQNKIIKYFAERLQQKFEYYNTTSVEELCIRANRENYEYRMTQYGEDID